MKPFKKGIKLKMLACHRLTHHSLKVSKALKSARHEAEKIKKSEGYPPFIALNKPITI